MIDRRDFIKTVLAGGAAALVAPGFVSADSRAYGLRRSGQEGLSDDAWARVPQILARIKPPAFAKRDFVITRHGGVGDGAKDCTDAFHKAVSACAAAGGGTVVVPTGRFLTGAIHLKSNVNLHLEKGATVTFSRDPRKYLPLVFTRWEGMELMNYSPFIYALEQENIAITGEGTIDGQADCDHWWPWKGRTNCGWKKGEPEQSRARALLYEMVAKGAPVRSRVFGEGSYLRPQFIQPYRCKNILIEGVTLKGSPMWQVHPVLCTNVTVRGLKIFADGPNTDGCDPESCKDVVIKDCYFSTGDDCIAIKSGRNNEGRRVPVPCENIVVQDCHMSAGHGGITVGSEISGGVRNLFGENCRMDSPNLNSSLRFKNNALRGGLLENFYFRDIDVGQVADATITMDFNYEEGGNGPFTPILRNVLVNNLKSKKSARALDLQGLEKAPVSNVRLENCVFENVAEANIVKNVSSLQLLNVRINGLITEAPATTRG
ncbi:MAG TPA: glycoside hydrolase family 28 protein [Blastocatellia bacterium]|nr:glycoside hydrolase family 28 protein [Blastocatellia bacterium]